jgi:hypothetical protein
VNGKRPLLVVDAANVVGSVPDGWWRDRLGANIRLREALAAVSSEGLVSARVPEPLGTPPIEVVLVVEGRARDVEGTSAVRVVSAPGSGDDAIVEVVRTEGADRLCVVATGDRALAVRVRTLGAVVIGPRSVPRR